MRLKSLRRFTALNMNDPNWGGGGGGQPHFASAGGKDKDGLSAAVDQVIALATK